MPQPSAALNTRLMWSSPGQTGIRSGEHAVKIMQTWGSTWFCSDMSWRRRRGGETNVKELLGFFDLPLSFQWLKIEPRLTTRHDGQPREAGCRCMHINGSVQEELKQASVASQFSFFFFFFNGDRNLPFILLDADRIQVKFLQICNERAK